MASSILAPLQSLLGSGNAVASGYKVFVYTAGTTTKINTYPTAADADAGTNANTNPVVLNSRGEPTSGGMWVPDSVEKYKLVLALPNDSDPPTSPVRTQDQITNISGQGGSGIVGFLQSGTGAVVRTALAKLRERFTPLDFGAAGDDDTTDTTAAQAELDSGAYVLGDHNNNGYKVGALTVPIGVRRIAGRKYTQAAVGSSVLNITGSPRLDILDCDMVGVAGTVPASNNSGIEAENCDHLHIRGGVYTGFRHHAAYLKDCRDSSVYLEGYSLTYGVRLRGCNGVTVRGQLSDTQVPDSTFSIAYGIDSTDGHAFGICENINMDVMVKNYVNAQAVLVHAGRNIRITGVFDNVLIGVSVGGFNDDDEIENITVHDVVYTGTTTAGAVSGGNYGLLVSGRPNQLAKNISVVGGTFRKGNYIVQSNTNGTIASGNIRGLTIQGCVIEDGYSPGISIGANVRGLVINGVNIKDIQTAGGQSIGVKVSGASNSWSDCQGIISDVVCEGVTNALRVGFTAAAAATSITSSGTTATLAKTAHGFKVGDWVRITGVTYTSATDAYYNGAFRVATVADANTLTYTMAGTPATATAPGSPTIQGSYDGLFINNVTAAGAATPIATAHILAVVDRQRRYVPGDIAPWVEETSALTFITNTAANTILNFRGGREGQILALHFTDSNTTVPDSGNFRLASAFTSTANDTLTLMFDGTAWCEIARSAN